MSVSEFDFYRKNNRIEAKNVLEVEFRASFRFGGSRDGMIRKSLNFPNLTGLWFPFQCIFRKGKTAITTDRKSPIVEYLESNETCSAREMADYVGLKASRLRDYLGELVEDEVIVAEGSNKNRRYLLSDS